MRSLTTFLQEDKYSGSVDTAFKGYNIRQAMRKEPELTMRAMVAMIKYVSDTIDANKRLTTAREYATCMDYLMNDDFGGNYTLEDFRIICEDIIVAKYFERCKISEFVHAWRNYDQRKLEAARRRQEAIRMEHERAQEEYQRNMRRLMERN
jgi:hypothetical protein